jgi:integrase/recombinase XerD
MDIMTAIAEFKHQLTARGYAENTIEAYRRDLGFFKQYLEERKIADIKTVTKQTLLDYQQKIMLEPIALETKALKIRAVKRFFEWLVETHRLLINPTEGLVETSRVNRKIGITLTPAEIKSILEQPNLSFPMQIRDRAVMEVFYATGIRLNELLNLEVYHADLKEQVLYIRKAKGHRQRVVPLGKKAGFYLKEYLTRIRPLSARKNPKERRLFLCKNGDPLSRDVVSIKLREYRLKAGIQKPVSPHTFRRTCATHLLQQGADIRYIQELLGHRSLKTTQVYTKVMPVEVKQTHEKTHPSGKFKVP